MVFNVAKVLTIKLRCRETDPSVLIFYARFLPALLLIAPAYYSGYTVHDTAVFIGGTIVAAILTLFASLLYVSSMQLGDLSLVSPMQAAVPVFMVLTTSLLYGETPALTALVLILLISASVAYVLLASAKRKGAECHDRVYLPVAMSLAAAALYGVSTVVDRVAIAATSNGAILYAACWNGITVGLLSYYLFKNHRVVVAEAKSQSANILLYALVVTIAFVLQQFAVQESIAIANGVTYVKAVVMIHIGIAALLGLFLLKEKVRPDLLFANAIALAGGMALLTQVSA